MGATSDAALSSDAGASADADAAPGWSEQHIQEQIKAAEFFEAHQQRIEREDAENQLIAVGVGLVIGLAIVIAVRLRNAR